MRIEEKRDLIKKISITNPEIAARLSAEYSTGSVIDFILYIIDKYSSTHNIAYYDTASRRCSYIRTKHVSIYRGENRPIKSSLCEASWEL